MFKDNPDFYPTPAKVALKMLARISKHAVNFLEPSAGKGDLADMIKEKGRDRGYRGYKNDHSSHRVDVIEIEPDLVAALRGKEYTIVGHDWLAYVGVSYYDAIVMNPPFSNGDEHLLKAWEFLWDGEIVCLLNAETVRNPHTKSRQRLAQIIREHGDVTEMGQCFRKTAGAQRATDVEVVMVYLRKKSEAEDLNDLWNKDGEEKRADDSAGEDAVETMLARPDMLGNLEHYYNSATEHLLKAFNHIRKASLYIQAGGFGSGYYSQDQKDMKDILELALSNVHHARAELGRKLRRDAWMTVFDKMQFHKWLDSKQREQFLRDVQRDANIPFTADNIKGTLENVISQRKRLFEQSCANVFDELTRHFDGNTVSEGWKTNDNFKVNEKLIFPYGVRYEPPKPIAGYRDHKTTPRWDTYYGRDAEVVFTDLDRILCVLEGTSFEKCHTAGTAIAQECRLLNDRPSTSLAIGGAGRETWSQHFEIRFFKKGTIHLKFKDRKLWERFNCACAAGKLWLGMNTNGRDEFPGRKTYHRGGKEVEIKDPPMPEDPMAMITALRKSYTESDDEPTPLDPSTPDINPNLLPAAHQEDLFA